MPAHRARGSARWRRAVPIVAGVCVVATVLGLAAWKLSGPPPPTGHGGRSIEAAPDGPAGPEPDPAATGSASRTPSASPGPTPGASPSRTPAASRTPAPAGTGAGQTQRFYVTFYSARDNTPPGSRDIAYPAVHRQAGGTGTYRDPITFATSRSELAVGTVVYYPYLKRYFVMEDDCTSCDQEWTGRGPAGGPRFPHIDLWAGAATDAGIVDCENALTQDGQVAVVVGPPPDLRVDPTPIYDSGHCYRPR
jgi:hypothetical protein